MSLRPEPGKLGRELCSLPLAMDSRYMAQKSWKSLEGQATQWQVCVSIHWRPQKAVCSDLHA